MALLDLRVVPVDAQAFPPGSLIQYLWSLLFIPQTWSGMDF